MTVLLWAILALVVGLAVIMVATWRAAPSRPPLPPDMALPATPLQRASAWSLAVGLLLAAGAAGIVIAYGSETTYRNDTIRLTFTFLLLASLITVAAATGWVANRARTDSSVVDERDRTIVDRAYKVQGAAMLLTLAVWIVGLTERFHGAGAVPTFYLFLVFWSCVIVHMLAVPVGVLLGYRRR